MLKNKINRTVEHKSNKISIMSASISAWNLDNLHVTTCPGRVDLGRTPPLQYMWKCNAEDNGNCLQCCIDYYKCEENKQDKCKENYDKCLKDLEKNHIVKCTTEIS